MRQVNIELHKFRWGCFSTVRSQETKEVITNNKTKSVLAHTETLKDAIVRWAILKKYRFNVRQTTL